MNGEIITDDEIWIPLDIKSDFKYEVSSLGRVKILAHLRKWKDGRHHHNDTRILKQTPKDNGYLTVNISFSTHNRKNLYVHRLIAMGFLPNPLNKKFINHKDGVRSNNLLSNLEWCTISENTLDSIKRGTWVHPNPPLNKK